MKDKDKTKEQLISELLELRQGIAELEALKIKHMQAENSLKTSHRFLEIANRHTDMIPLLKEFVAEVKKLSDCDAVGIRLLDEEGNIPYKAYEGFSQRFYESESPLSIKSDQCMCINVIKGTTDPKLPFYTKDCSFYMNGTTQFLATVSEQEKGQTRNVCNEVGYESVALVPIRSGDRILGLIHVADQQEDMVPLDLVNILEWVAMQLGTAIQRVRTEQALRESHDELEQRVQKRTVELIVANEQIKESLREKEVLLKEIHHRVKNNLQVISSLLDMTGMRIHDQQANDLITDARSKIHTMALIHARLYRSERFDQIDMRNHILELVGYLSQVYSEREGITPVVEPTTVNLAITQAIPCALVLNEVISNAFKHAFKQGQKGMIEISIKRSDSDTIFIRVKDDGIGIPEEVDIYKTDSLGLKLLRNLVHNQLKGKIDLKRDKGTEFIIEFKTLEERTEYVQNNGSGR